MASDSTTRWPLLEERAPFATASRSRRTRKPPRSAWLLTGLAFLCGGLVSAAAFSVGWRHQAQRDTVAQTALAAATARTHRLEQSIGALRASLGRARGTAARANAAAAAAATAEKALVQTGATVAAEATVSSGDGNAIAAGAGSLITAAARITSELKTLNTYLTTTPAGQLDPGYVASQTAYLSRQLARLQADAGTLGSTVTSFESTLRKLSHDASGLRAH